MFENQKKRSHFTYERIERVSICIFSPKILKLFVDFIWFYIIARKFQKLREKRKNVQNAKNSKKPKNKWKNEKNDKLKNTEKTEKRKHRLPEKCRKMETRDWKAFSAWPQDLIFSRLFGLFKTRRFGFFETFHFWKCKISTVTLWVWR